MDHGDATPNRPARLSRASRREQLLDVTKAIVGADGLHAVSIDRVAREAGISRPIVYEHFTDLAGLLRALLDREGARALAQLQGFMPTAPADSTTPPPLPDVLIATLAAYLDAVQSDPVTWRLMLMPREGAPAFLRARVEEARDTVVAQLAQLLESTFGSAAALRPPDPLLAASSIQALAVHWSRLILNDPRTFTRERILRNARWAISRLTDEPRPE